MNDNSYWTGFPADGIWYVTSEGRSSTCIIRMGDIPKKPWPAVNYLSFADELSMEISKFEKERNHSCSLRDFSEFVCEFFAKKASKKKE